MRNFIFLTMTRLGAFAILFFGMRCGVHGQTGPSGEKFGRDGIVRAQKAKADRGAPLIAHVLVPLCDNENQGIVPVGGSLGDGQNLRSNLYWGAGYGIKTHFRRLSDWKLVAEEKPAEAHVLERVVFRKQFPGGPLVYLVADAYDGAHMRHCIDDFFASLNGSRTGNVVVGCDTLPAWGGADLVAFNGHNGLMDLDVSPPALAAGTKKDAVVIACYSHAYFADYLALAGGYPLVCTTHLLAPEAYVLRAVLDAWGARKSAEDIRLAAGRAYHAVQQCGLRGATRLFRTGW